MTKKRASEPLPDAIWRDACTTCTDWWFIWSHTVRRPLVHADIHTYGQSPGVPTMCVFTRMPMQVRGRKCNLHTEKPQLVLAGLNPGPSCCQGPAWTTHANSKSIHHIQENSKSLNTAEKKTSALFPALKRQFVPEFGLNVRDILHTVFPLLD